MGRFFQPARIPSGGLESIQAMPYPNGQTFDLGGVVVANANGEVIECANNPTVVTGVALQPANTGPGFGMAGNPTMITGRSQVASIAIANRQTVFSGRMVNGATDPVTPTQNMIGLIFGIKKVLSDWVVDQTMTTDATSCVEITDVDIDNKVVFFKFREAFISQP